MSTRARLRAGAATRCDHRLGGGPLVCTRPDAHQPGHGCTYESTSHVDAEPA